MRLVRDLGFDPVVFGQHFLAAEAGPTRLAVTIYLLPLLNPVAVAEEAASLDIQKKDQAYVAWEHQRAVPVPRP